MIVPFAIVHFFLLFSTVKNLQVKYCNVRSQCWNCCDLWTNQDYHQIFRALGCFLILTSIALRCTEKAIIGFHSSFATLRSEGKSNGWDKEYTLGRTTVPPFTPSFWIPQVITTHQNTHINSHGAAPWCRDEEKDSLSQPVLKIAHITLEKECSCDANWSNLAW